MLITYLHSGLPHTFSKSHSLRDKDPGVVHAKLFLGFLHCSLPAVDIFCALSYFIITICFFHLLKYWMTLCHAALYSQFFGRKGKTNQKRPLFLSWVLVAIQFLEQFVKIQTQLTFVLCCVINSNQIKFYL